MRSLFLGLALTAFMGGSALAQPVWLSCYADIADARLVYVSGAIPAQASNVRRDGDRLTTTDSRAYAAQEPFNAYVEAQLGRPIFGAECELFPSVKAAQAHAAGLPRRWTNYRFIETGWVGAKP